MSASFVLNVYCEGLTHSRFPGGVARFQVVVVAGMEPGELKAVLERQVGARGVVGLVDAADESIFSLSIACEAPELLTAGLYRILLEQVRVVGGRAEGSGVSPMPPARSDSDSGEGEGELGDEQLWLLQAHMLMAVTQLEDQNELPGEAADVLRRLVSEGDERALAAMELFLEEHDWDDLQDTLQRIARIELAEMRSGRQPPLEAPGEEEEEEDDDDEFGQSEDDGPLMDRELMWEVTDVLLKRGLLSKSEAVVVKKLVDIDNPLVHAASEVFEAHGDEEDFADTLRRITAQLGIESTVLGLLQQGYIVKDEAALLVRLFLDAGSPVTRAWALYCEHRNQRVFGDQLLTLLIFYDKKRFLMRMKMRDVFDAVETSIQLDMLHRSDPAFLAVFDVLVQDGDLADAIDSLKRLCVIRMAQARPEDQDYLTRTPSTLTTEASETLDLVQALVLDGVITEVQFQILRTLVIKQDERIMAAYGTFAKSRGLDEFIDTLKQISLLAVPEAIKESIAPKSGFYHDSISRDKTMLDAMFMLVRIDKLAPEEAAVLGDLVTAQDPRLLAAFDVYHMEQDEEDLADSLSRLALQELSSKSLDEYEQFVNDEEDEEEREEEDDDDEDLEDDDEDSASASTITSNADLDDFEN